MSDALPGLGMKRQQALIFLIVGTGVVSVFQIGKVAVALSVMRADLNLDIATVSWFVSVFALVGAVTGAAMGLAVDHIGAKRLVVFGLLVQGTCSAAGSMVADTSALLALRAVEGFGFLAVIVAAPALIVAAALPRDRDRAIATWATFMPAGLTLIMLMSPLLSLLGWRGFWLFNALILSSYALWVLAAIPSAPVFERRPIVQDIKQALAAPGPWLLGGLFAVFSAVFFIVISFLPTILAERFGVTADAASGFTAVVVAANGVGTVIGGQLLVRGIEPMRMLAVSFGVMALCGFGIFGDALPGVASYAFSIALALISGTIPVVILRATTHYAPHPTLAGVTMGFAMQGNNLGLLMGPAAAGSIATTTGWAAVPYLILAVVAVALLLIGMLARLQPRAVPTRELA